MNVLSRKSLLVDFDLVFSRNYLRQYRPLVVSVNKQTVILKIDNEPTVYDLYIIITFPGFVLLGNLRS